MSEIRILHIFNDEKFFDTTASFFDSMVGVSNTYVYYSATEDYVFKYIKSVEKVKVISDLNEYHKILKDKTYDFVYLHSLSPAFYDYVLMIPQEVKIIWWSWGYDIYYSWRRTSPLIDIELYKPLTKELMRSQRESLSHKLKNLLYTLCRPYSTYKLRKVISRIDYYTPVISTEYDLLGAGNDFFKAKPFMLTMGPGNSETTPLSLREKAGNILVGNSLSYTNNHLDVFASIAECRTDSGQNYVIPISYGDEFDSSILKAGFTKNNVIWLESFIPFIEYKRIFDSVSHAIFGMMRQQAMGNIYMCLKNGIKIFLYKDSIIYKFLSESGFVVFSIEDMDENTLLTPLDKESAQINHNLIISRIEKRHECAYNELVKIYKDKL